jgi:MFS family permease
MADSEHPGADPSNRTLSSNSQSEARKLSAVFSVLAFFQGLNEPTEGLLMQPVRSMLGNRDWSIARISTLFALLSLPWLLKPVFGVVTDSVPLWGTRRRSYLTLLNAAASTAFLTLAVVPSLRTSTLGLFVPLLIAATAVAFADVAADALMVERGQSLGMTGRFQAFQWASLYASGLVLGPAGGELASRGLEHWGFVLCAAGSAVAMLVSAQLIDEPRVVKAPADLRNALADLAEAARTPGLAGIGLFLFLWNFNPFSNAVLQFHMTRALEFDERFVGYTVSLTAMASIGAGLVYALVCRRIPTAVLIHLSIVLGIASNLAYLALGGTTSAALITICVGFAYMFATLIQLDLAARFCPPAVAGTVFAILMAMENLAASASSSLGGILYDLVSRRWGVNTSFQVLVGTGAMLTAGCWLVLKAFPLAEYDASQEETRTSG